MKAPMWLRNEARLLHGKGSAPRLLLALAAVALAGGLGLLAVASPGETSADVPGGPSLAAKLALKGAPAGEDSLLAEEIDGKAVPFDMASQPQVASDGEADLVPLAGCPQTALTNDGSTSGNARAPSTRYRGARSVYLITAAELAALGFPTGGVQGLGWEYQTAPGVAGTGSLIVYLQNTTDTTYLKGTTFSTAIAGMTTVHNAATLLPGTVGTFDFPFSGGSPFTYTGGGLYVAFDWSYPTGTLSTVAVVACNTSLVSGLAGSQTTGAPPAANALTPSNWRPSTRLAPAVGLANDVSVDIVQTLGLFPGSLGSPHAVRAIVTNRGGNLQTNLPVTLTVSGANSYTNTQTVASLAACSGVANITFPTFTPTNVGANNVGVSVPADDNNANNSISRGLDTTVNRYSYKHTGTTPDGGVGFTGATGQFVAKFSVNAATQVDSALLEFFSVTATTYQVVIYGDAAGTPGAQLYVDSFNRTVTAAGPVTIRLPSPVAVGPGVFYVGVQQTNTTNASYSFDIENPIRNGTFFYSSTLNAGPWTDQSPGANFKTNIGVVLGSCLVPMSVDVTPDGTTSACAGGSILYSANVTGGTGSRTYQWTENGVNIAGATASTYTATKASAGSFTYNVKVTDDGACVNVADPVSSTGNWIANGAPCDDGNSCTIGDVCGSGVCQPGPNPCDDGNACTNDICDGGPPCTYTAVVCDDANVCTDDSCNPATGCVFTGNQGPCSDGNPCTIGDACSGGSCVPGPTGNFPSAQFCTTSPIVIPSVGAAAPYPSNLVVSGAPSFVCSLSVNLNGITHSWPGDIDILLSGPGTPNAKIMSDVGEGNFPITNVNLLLTDAAAASLPATGTIVSGTYKPTDYDAADSFPAPAPVPLGSSVLSVFNGQNPNTTWRLWVVDDTSGDTGAIASWCVNVSGACASAAECNDNNPCTDDTCNNGVCSFTNNSNACDDGNACTQTDTCSGGACAGGNPVNCDDSNACTDDSCLPATGQCQNVATNCDDNNICTNDFCDTGSGCFYTPAAGPCNDENACTTNDQCTAGVCQGGAPLNCDDANPCTSDECNPFVGCMYSSISGPCDDGNACTVGDVCGPPVPCNPAESFDGVTAPALPAGWVAAIDVDGAGNEPWRTVTTQADSPPNSVFTNAPAVVTSKRVESPLFAVISPTTSLSFRNRYDYEAGFDGGVLEIKIGAGPFQDFVTAGGAFIFGGYTHSISTAWGNPLAGRQAWSARSGGGASATWITSLAIFPAAAAGQNVVLRWRAGTDSSVPGVGQWIDSVSVFDPGCLNVCVPGTPVGAPPEVQGLGIAADKVTVSWAAAPTATDYDVVRGSVAALPVGPGGGDEVCIAVGGSTSTADPTTPAAGQASFYVSRGKSGCGIGPWGNASNGAPRITTTCP